MKENWRATVPQMRLVITFGIFYAITFPIDILAYYANLEVPREIIKIRILFLGIASAFHGLFRGLAFHPLHDLAYRQWLSVTPWASDKPLPKGPVHLIWTDILFLVVLSLLVYSNDVMLSAVPVVAFLGAYLLGVNATFLGGPKGFLVTTLFLAPLTFYPHKNVFIAGFVLVSLYLFARVGMYQYFKNFPWNTDYWTADQIKELRRYAIRMNMIGWPFKSLGVFDAPSAALLEAFLLSLLLTWWVHIFLWGVDVPAGEALKITLPFVALLAALIRFIVYKAGRSAPISLFGRIVTGYLIIPRHDKIYIAPLCIAAVGILLPWALGQLHMQTIWVGEISLFAVLFLTFSLPPTLKSWRLTGAHHIVRPVLVSQKRPESEQGNIEINLFQKA